MTSFRRTLFGYRKPEVDAAVVARDSHISGLEQQAAVLGEAKAECLDLGAAADAHFVAPSASSAAG